MMSLPAFPVPPGQRSASGGPGVRAFSAATILRLLSVAVLPLWMSGGGLVGGAAGQEPVATEPETTETETAPEAAPESDPESDPEEQPAAVEPEADAEPVVEPPPEEDTGFEEMAVLARAIELIRENYVDRDKVSYEQLVAHALDGMLSALDPHCQYLHPRVFEQMQREQTNTYDGVGITIAPKNEALSIVSVREDGPAARAGILPADQIIKIGDVLAEEVGLAEAVGLLAGNPGETLVLTIRRPSTQEILQVEMVRQVIQRETVKDPLILDPSMTGDVRIGYVRLLQFNEPSAGELAEALNDLEAQGMEALVLDLRNNPGGLLDTAIRILGEFVPPGTVVLTTEGRDPTRNPPPYRTPDNGGHPREYPMVVLVNHGSASASEVVSGALQDLKRAVVVGETTFGKGSVQSVIPMERGAAMRITTAKYYTPSHRTIHENGVVPNIVATLTPEEEQRLMRWYGDNALNNVKARELAKLGDRQLERAIDVLKGLKAYRAGDTTGTGTSTR